MSDLQAIDLNLDERVTLGLSAAPPETFKERVYLGRTRVGEFEGNDLTSDQRSHVEAHPDLRFTRAEVPLTLVHDEENPFESVWLQITLHTEPSDGAAISRWLDPSFLFDAIETTTTDKIGAALKVTAEHTEESKSTGRVPYLEALYDGGPTPTWSFTRTENQIRGRYLLSMVVEAERDARVTAEARLGATVRAKKLGIFSYAAKLTPVVGQLFDLRSGS
ncbi:hypothetical protein ACWDCB_08500 [Streptomyces sp. NPDC001178]